MHVPINVKSLNNISEWQMGFNSAFKGLNPICCLLALLGAHHFLHVSRIRVKNKICLCNHELAGPIGRSPAEIAGSNPTGGMGVRLFCVCVCVLCRQVEVSGTG
jgi:hypothetical protein